MSARRIGFTIGGAALAVATVVGVSIVWPGLDAQETPPVDTTLWALQTADGRRYARVNTAIGELDTVRTVANPSSIVQTDDGAFLFAQSYGRVARIDDALPIDLDDEALRTVASTPQGTVEATSSGGWVVYRSDTGVVNAGRLSTGIMNAIDPTPPEDGDAPDYTADAVAVDPHGVVYAYSRAEASVLEYDITSGTVTAQTPVGEIGDGAVITATDGTWYLYDPEAGDVRIEGVDQPVPVATVGAFTWSRTAAEGDAAYLADESGLVRVPQDGSAPERVFGGDARDVGVPARPTVFHGDVYAAWLSDTGGTLWRSGAGETSLDYNGLGLDDTRRPTFVSNGSAMILNETRSGWVWSMPDAALVRSSQDWTLDRPIDASSEPADEQAELVVDPKPPVAEPDAFGVRAGGITALPVLLNDHDPNDDVLSVDAGSIAGLDPEFGTVRVTDGGGRLAVQVSPTATGTAQFQYRVTDGTAEDGLYSPPTTVTLTVSEDGVNSPPAWCGVDGCLATWPEPEVAPGGTVTVPVLNGWVDPDGDPIMLLSAEDTSGLGSVAATPAGDIVYQHHDPSDTQQRIVELAVVVADVYGATAQKTLRVRVQPSPKLTAESFTVIDTQGVDLTVDVAPHVTGTAGSLSLSAVRAIDDAGAEASLAASATSFDFSAATPGVYRVQYTVTDGTNEAIATARITILPADAAAQLATAPVVAFVRPQEDATIDVLGAVSNPTRRVLLVSEVTPTPAAHASLQVDTVGQHFIRVAGATADGNPGLLGTVRYTVGDGTDDDGARIEGQATVYLLPPTPDIAPIAVDDAVVVRAGSQLDIPVLDNDVAPSGATLTLDPASVVSSTPDALAFASGRLLRYLAPSEPGEYRVQYSVYAAGSPSLADTADVRVTVIGDEANRAPRPRLLEGRVLSGQTTVIPFHSFGVDPDGDPVSLERIVTQPASGSAVISADGDGIVYASTPGFRGQVSFTYRVVDAQGATKVGTARVGVLDAQSNPSPVTFTDYVQVTAGATSTVRVRPLANDVDPTGGTLEITDVRPDLTTTLEDGTSNPEHDKWAARLTVGEDGEVRILAGEDPGTMSFLYDVESSSGNTGRGLIVVRVVREYVPEYPVIADTLLSTQTRDRFASGVDVLAGKVSWGGGDVGDLRVALWGDQEDVSVSGRQLRGPLPETARVIPFSVTGTGADGQDVVSYAFLRVPGEKDITLALRTGLPPFTVQERESVSFDMAKLVVVPDGAVLEVGQDLTPTGARPQATCTLAGTTVTYAAGEGAPWTDACRVPVRVVGQDEWTYLSVAIRVQPLDPQPILKSASLTVDPGGTASFDLTTLTEWGDRTDWDALRYAIEQPGAPFTATLTGTVVTVTAEDAAVPGAEAAVGIAVTSHQNVVPSRLVLRVGQAPAAQPRGGTATKLCSQAEGSSCTITIVGAPGEVNPLPRTPLVVSSVTPRGSCVGVTFGVASDAAISVSWAGDAPGATCSAAVVLTDAQGRSTSGERAGTVTVDLQGYPRGPASLTQIAYANTSLTLRVDPGAARVAYPAVSSYVVRSGGSVVATCSADGTCPAITAPNGEERSYEAVAVNAVGESRERATASAWAYNTPAAPAGATAVPIPTADGTGGDVSLTVTGVDTAQTATLEITSATGERVTVPVEAGRSTVTIPRYALRANAPTPVTITPLSRFALPAGLAGSTSGSAVTVTAFGIGKPSVPALTLTPASTGPGRSSVTAVGSATPGGPSAVVHYGFAAQGSTCTPSSPSSSFTFTDLQDGNEYGFVVCAASVYAGQSFGVTETSGAARGVQSDAAPTGYTFAVQNTPEVSGTEAAWRITQAPVSASAVPNNNRVEFSRGAPYAEFGSVPIVDATYVHNTWGTATKPGRVQIAAGSAPYQVKANWAVNACVGGQALDYSTSSTNNAATIGVSTRYTVKNGPDVSDQLQVPDKATKVTVTFTVTWSGPFAMLNGHTAQVKDFTCTPTPDVPDPDPGGGDDDDDGGVDGGDGGGGGETPPGDADD